MAGNHRIATAAEGGPGPRGELSRELTLFHITMMGLGMMIGAGVFLGTGKSIAWSGPGGVILTFALNGLIAVFTAMSYAELSSAIPRAGGAYNFARVAFGRQSSFVAGWMEWFASSVAGSLYSVCFATYTVRFFSGLEIVTLTEKQENFVVKLVAICVAGLFIYVNYRGASATGNIGAIVTVGQTLILVFIGVIGLWVVIKDPQRLSNFKPFLNHEHGGWAALFVTMGFTSVAFEGFEVIAQAGDETVNPRKNIPKAMLYSVLIVTLTYVLVAFATVVAVKAGAGLTIDGSEVAPWRWIGHHDEQGFGAAVEQLMPRSGGLLVMLAVIFASTSALNATIYSATRASYALGRDRMLPGLFSKISKKQNTPYVALAGTGAIVLVVASCLPTVDVAASASIMFLMLFFMVNLCVVKIRRSMADELTYGYLMPLFPVFPALAIACQAVLAVELRHISPTAWIIAPAWIGSGLLVYHLYSKRRAVATEDEILVLEEQKEHKSERYPIMVAVANPANAVELVQCTYRLCDAKQGQVELIHMVPVPVQVSLTDADKYMLRGKEALTEAMLYLSMHFPISTTLRYCRNTARGIVSAIREKKTKMLVVGWHGRPTTHLFNIGATVDPLIEQAPCNVVVLKDCGGNKQFKNALVPLAGGLNGALALEIASILTDAPEEGSSNITVFTVDTGKRAFDLDAFLDRQCDKLGLGRNRYLTKTVEARTVVPAILKEARKYDLVVMGMSQKPLLMQMATQSLPEEIAWRCKKPIVMVKSDLGVRSWINRWI